MDAIEIFFTAYGALLALAIAKVMVGASRLLRSRATVRIGWTTPLLMLLLVLDACSFINNASHVMGLADLSLGMVATGVLASGAYYMAATLVVPDDLSEWPDLDAYYDRQKPFVLGGMLVGSLLGFEVTSLLVRGLSETIAQRWTGLQAALSLSYYLLLGVLLFIRNRATNLVMLATLNAIYVIVMIAA